MAQLVDRGYAELEKSPNTYLPSPKNHYSWLGLGELRTSFVSVIPLLLPKHVQPFCSFENLPPERTRR